VTPAVRRALFVGAGAGLTALLLWALAGLPDFGHYRGPYGLVLNRVAVSERHATDVVTAVVFDYRGFDTLGEEFILFASALGTALLLRGVRGVGREIPKPTSGPALRTLAAALAAGVLVLGLFVVAHGYITPGGGFQGGVVLASSLVVVYLTAGFQSFRKLGPTAYVDLAEGLGAGGYVALGLAALVSGSAFLANVLPLGRTGTLLSSGTIPLLNAAAAVAVTAAFVLVFTEFLEEVATRGSGGQ
jgi:multicomponent Na+:H+ antiporter subunit B